MRRIGQLLLLLALLGSLCIPASAITETQLSAAAEKGAAYLLTAVPNPQVGSVGGEWAVIGLARSGCGVPQEYWDDYYDAARDYVKGCKGVLHTRKYTEYSRVVLALTAIGADPASVAGYDLLAPLGDFEKTVWQGINGPIWALIALDSGNYEIPANKEAKTQATRQMYVDEILRCQLENGGWNLTDEGGEGQADPDVTAMALQALAKYQYQGAVKVTTDKALICLSHLQDFDGGYTSGGLSNSESVAQVIVALCELGIDLNDSRFVKNGNTLLDKLLSYQRTDGSFAHEIKDKHGNQMTTEQSFYALTAAMRTAQGKNSLYRMDDCSIRVSAAQDSGSFGLPGKQEAVQRVPVIVPGTTFADISAHKNRSAVEVLAARGILNGYSANTFGPNDTMTRAQFAAVVVRALGLPMQTTNTFTDVRPEDWCAAYVGTACACGIVNGTTTTTFTPNGTITRQQAAAMVARAAKLCGMDTAMDSYEIRNTLSQFGDYVTVSPWAQESMAFCYSAGILDQSDLNIEPMRPILRCEIAQMICNLLESAKLL